MLFFTHASHSLSFRDGVYYCEKCGDFACKQIHKLKQPCGGHENRTRHGDLTLQAVAQGFGPSKRASACVSVGSSKGAFNGLSFKRIRPSRVEDLPAPTCNIIPVPCTPLETPLNPHHALLLNLQDMLD